MKWCCNQSKWLQRCPMSWTKCNNTYCVTKPWIALTQLSIFEYQSSLSKSKNVVTSTTIYLVHDSSYPSTNALKTLCKRAGKSKCKMELHYPVISGQLLVFFPTNNLTTYDPFIIFNFIVKWKRFQQKQVPFALDSSSQSSSCRQEWFSSHLPTLFSNYCHSCSSITCDISVECLQIGS